MDSGVIKRSFAELVGMRRGLDFAPPEHDRLLILDPGETTGWALFEQRALSEWGQAPTKSGWHEIDDLFEYIMPTKVVYENYRVYEHKLSRHANSEVFTLRLIGVIEYLCDVKYGAPYHNQMAHQAKGFVTDDKLKQWGFYKTGQKHARDAIRHGCYYQLFDNGGGK